LAFAIFRRRLFDLIPVARDAIIEEMIDGLLVIDLETRIVDINPAAKMILGIQMPSVLGMPVDKVITFWPRISSGLTKDAEFDEEILIDERVPRYLHIRVRPLCDARSQKGGWFLVIQDITERKQIDEKVSRAKSLESMGILAGGIKRRRRMLLAHLFAVNFIGRATGKNFAGNNTVRSSRNGVRSGKKTAVVKSAKQLRALVIAADETCAAAFVPDASVKNMN
jgi:PAS domain S-box-containing protein